MMNGIASHKSESGKFQSFVDPSEWVATGEESFRRGAYGESVQFFEKATIDRPFDATIQNNLSVALWHVGDIERSLQHLTRALELEPHNRDVVLNCTQVFRKLGRDAYAQEVLESYLAGNPWDDEVRREMNKPSSTATSQTVHNVAHFFNEQGENQYQTGHREHARACFEMALEGDPEYGEAHNNLGVILLEEGKTEEALEHFYQALEADPLNADTLVNSAKGLQALGDWDTAAEYVKLYLQQNPKDEEAWNDYADLIRSLALSRIPEDLLDEAAEA
jgi:tetratricopeptide (TPR) repeat protein